MTDLSKVERRRKPFFSPIVGRNRKATEWTFDCLAGRPKHRRTPRPSFYELLHPHRPGPMARPKLHDAFACRFVAEAREHGRFLNRPFGFQCGTGCLATRSSQAKSEGWWCRRLNLVVGEQAWEETIPMIERECDPHRRLRRAGLHESFLDKFG